MYIYNYSYYSLRLHYMDNQLQEVQQNDKLDNLRLASKYVGVPSRANLYSKLARYAPRAIATLNTLLKSKNDMVRLNAVRLLLSKVLPDLRSVEGETNKNTFNITVNMGNGYKPYIQPIVIDSNDVSEANKDIDVQ